MLAPRLEALRELLAPTGTLWVHLDWRAAYLVRVLLDEILGRDAFMNEIVWRRAPNLGRQAASQQFGRTLDTLVVYGGPRRAPRAADAARAHRPERPSVGDDEGRPFTTAPRGDYTDASIARLDAEGRVHRTATGSVYIKYFLVKDADGEWCRERRVDALWTDVPPLRHARADRAHRVPDAEAARAPRAHHRVRHRRGRPRGRPLRGQRHHGRGAHALGRRFVLGDAGLSRSRRRAPGSRVQALVLAWSVAVRTRRRRGVTPQGRSHESADRGMRL